MGGRLPYERGTLLRSTSDDHAKLRALVYQALVDPPGREQRLDRAEGLTLAIGSGGRGVCGAFGAH